MNGFRYGFDLHFTGNREVKQKAPNLKLRVGSKLELWNKVMKEVQAKRYAGPYENVPYENFIQSPIGLVPKDQGKKTHLIFHLLYPRCNDTSVNAGIPKEFCTVRYLEFTDAFKMCLNLCSEQIFCRKSDISMAFRHVPLRVKDFNLLILKAEHPRTGKTYWFVEKCLPFGSSISCAIFQAVSDSISFLETSKTGKPTLNYLDDYFWVEILKLLCDHQVNTFLKVCEQIKFPVSLEKTHWGTRVIVFLGFLLDTVNKRIGIPIEKITKALDLIQKMLNKKKITVRKVPKLCGFLNFLGRAILPGRAFTRQLYAMYTSSSGKELKAFHHIKVKSENKLDLTVWQKFLTHCDLFTKSFVDFANPEFTTVRMYSDALRNFKMGFGAWCENSWMQSFWDTEFMCEGQPSIEYLELFALTAGVIVWVKRFKNLKIQIYCDNESVCPMVTATSSKCRNCMVLIHLIVLECLFNNVQIRCKHVGTKNNGRADALSQGQFKHF